MKKLLFIFTIALFLVLVACSMPSTAVPTDNSPDAAFTAAAQTVAAELTRISQNASPTPEIPTEPPAPTSTFTPTLTNTPIPSPTKTSLPCLMVGFNNATIDQTVPDNTVMAPGQAFVKTWRLINMGVCTWNSSYQLIFDHGDGMGVPAGFAQTMTSGSVGYGKTVDVSVSLVAPSAPGTYTGYWRFRDPNGINFGIGGTATWIVKIVVQNATTVSLTPVPALSGALRSDGGPTADFTVGEFASDNSKMVQLFLDFDISGIPSNATISDVKLDLRDYTKTGNPFGLGVLNGYPVDYGTSLEPADFAPSYPPGNIVDWGSTTPLDTVESQPYVKTALQSRLGKGYFQLRLQFPGPKNDSVTDSITFNHPTLIVKYITP